MASPMVHKLSCDTKKSMSSSHEQFQVTRDNKEYGASKVYKEKHE